MIDAVPAPSLVHPSRSAAHTSPNFHSRWLAHRQHNGTGNRHRDVVMGASRVRDRVPARGCRAALQAQELPDHPRVVEQLDAARIQDRQKREVVVGREALRDLIGDPEIAELLTRPLPP